MSSVVYAEDRDLTVDEYVAVVGSTYMRDKRPLANRDRIAAMLAGANLVVTARDAADGTILGLARGISDGAWICYLGDLVVRDGQQGKGIGTGLLDECSRLLGPGVGLVLVSYPEAEPFYRRIGMEPAQAFWRPRGDAA